MLPRPPVYKEAGSYFLPFDTKKSRSWSRKERTISQSPCCKPRRSWAPVAVSLTMYDGI